MAEDHMQQTSRDRIVEEVVDKVAQRPSVDSPREEIRSLAEDSVDELAERPVQTFTPLLAENEVLGALLGDRDDEVATDRDGQGTS